MDPLAAPDDVAHELGLEDADALSESQTLRVASLLVRVSRSFRREAEREFTPGTTTLRLLTVGGRLHMPDPIDEVETVTVADCDGDPVDVDYEIDGQELSIRYPRGRSYPSGVPVTVTYTHTAEIPQDVVDTVAAIVARHLTVDPSTANVAEEAAGPFRTKYAGWVSDLNNLLTEGECCAARTYRHPLTSVIIRSP